MPTPPGPTRLSRRQSSWPSISAMRRRSIERPTKPSSAAAASAASGGERGAVAALAPTRLSCSACSSAPGARPRSSLEAGGERPVHLPGAAALAACASACRCRRSAASSSGSASSSRPDRATASLGIDLAGGALQDRAAPGDAQPVALEAEPARPGLASRRRRSRRAGRRRSEASASSIRPSRSAASNSATSVGTSSRAVCPCSSIGRPQGTLCRRNSVLRRLAKASFWRLLRPEASPPARRGRPSRASGPGRPAAGCAARTATPSARRRGRSSASRTGAGGQASQARRAGGFSGPPRGGASRRQPGACAGAGRLPAPSRRDPTA